MIPIDIAFQSSFLRIGTRLNDNSGLAPHVKSTAPSTTITVRILIAGLAFSANQILVLNLTISSGIGALGRVAR